MSYKFKADENVGKAFRRIGESQIKKAIGSLETMDENPAEAIHDARKRCKKLRALVRLVRPGFSGYACENAAFRDAAKPLAGTRDGQALLEAFDDLVKRHEGMTDRFARVRRRLVAERDEHVRHLPAVEESLELLRGAERRCSSWELENPGFAAIAGGVKKTYARARKGYRQCRADPSPLQMHEWRKRVKYHGYHLRLLAPLWAPMSEGQLTGVEDLASLLGAHHDLANLSHWLEQKDLAPDEEEDVTRLQELLEERMKELTEDALANGRMALALKPKDLLGIFERWWKAAHRREKSP